MDCKEFHKILEDYENLTAEEKLTAAEHAADCDACAKEFSDYMSMTETLRSLPMLTAPEDFLTKLNERIDRESLQTKTKRRVWLHLKRYAYRYSAAAACLALIAVIGINNSELVNRMMSPDDGVISSEVLPTLSPASERPHSSPNIASPSPVPSATAQPTGSAAPKASATAGPTSAPKQSTAKLSSPTAKPIATAVPKVSAPTLSPKATEAPVKEESAPVFNDNNDTASADSAAEAATASKTEQPLAAQSSENEAADSEVQAAAAYGVMDPNAYMLPDDSAVSEHNSQSGFASGYSRMRDSRNSIEVSYANAEKAKEIINEYSIDNDGDYYSVSSDMMEEFLQAMSNAGIEFDENCIEYSDDTVIFRLIIS